MFIFSTESSFGSPAQRGFLEDSKRRGGKHFVYFGFGVACGTLRTTAIIFGSEWVWEDPEQWGCFVYFANVAILSPNR